MSGVPCIAIPSATNVLHVSYGERFVLRQSSAAHRSRTRRPCTEKHAPRMLSVRFMRSHTRPCHSIRYTATLRVRYMLPRLRQGGNATDFFQNGYHKHALVHASRSLGSTRTPACDSSVAMGTRKSANGVAPGIGSLGITNAAAYVSPEALTAATTWSKNSHYIKTNAIVFCSDNGSRTMK
jgi:hypothetical protein